MGQPTHQAQVKARSKFTRIAAISKSSIKYQEWQAGSTLTYARNARPSLVYARLTHSLLAQCAF